MIELRPMTAADWSAVEQIYQEGIESGNATFETQAPSWENWDAGHLANCRLVAVSAAQVVGWAALSPVSGRCVYAGVAEVSVYIGTKAQRQGVGTALLHALIAESEEAGIWTLQAGIFPENNASLRTHEKCGFRVVGRRERIGQMNGLWRDVMLLERRSASIE